MEGLVGPQAHGLARDLLSRLAAQARAYRFAVAPNPCVGASILAGGREVGLGFHTEWGGPHAEIEAFAAARRAGVREESWEALVITLEPCCSTGKTPACTDAILATSIPVIFVGALDPDPRHRGKGLELLREAGREVVLLDGGSPLEEAAPHFLRWTSSERIRRPRPWTIDRKSVV